MNQRACLLAMRELMSANEDTLIDGFNHQGQPRKLNTVAVTPLSAPNDYYFVMAQVRKVTSMSFPGSGNVARPVEKCFYDCTIHIADAASATYGEEAAFEDVALDFRILSDRIVALLRGVSFSAPSPDDGPTFKLPTQRGGDREVTVVNMDHNWSDVSEEIVVPILYSTISFQLEEC